ncbi:MAG: hypothetical protein AB7Q37_02220 [Pyrinomonadaceae bacterium]
MEFLIPGLILVGFMVWASTRIKRNAARAFEEETVETEEFSLVKPEGFLSHAEPPAGLLFSAYSKEYGRDDAESLRQAVAEVRRFDGAAFDDIREAAKQDGAGLVSEQTGVIAERRCANIVVEGRAKGVAIETYHKIIAGERAVYQLSVSVLSDHRDDLSAKVDRFIDSFALK